MCVRCCHLGSSHTTIHFYLLIVIKFPSFLFECSSFDFCLLLSALPLVSHVYVSVVLSELELDLFQFRRFFLGHIYSLKLMTIVTILRSFISFSQLYFSFTWHSVLNEDVPYKLRHLNTWSLFGGTVWRGSGGTNPLEKVMPGGLRDLEASSHSQFALFASRSCSQLRHLNFEHPASRTGCHASQP